MAGVRPLDDRDRVLTLLTVYNLHCAPLQRLGSRVRLQHAPAVAELKGRLEQEWLDELAVVALPALPADPVAALRTLAARDRLPATYRWLSREAGRDEVRAFLALEGGPDGGFDDLVACQIGLSGSAKLEMATNYWDEMGNGDADEVHTVLHERVAPRSTCRYWSAASFRPWRCTGRRWDPYLRRTGGCSPRWSGRSGSSSCRPAPAAEWSCKPSTA